MSEAAATNHTTAIIASIGTLIAGLGGPKVFSLLMRASSRRAAREDALRDELRTEAAALRAELKAQVADLQEKYEKVVKELAEWQQKYFKLEADHRVLQVRLDLLSGKGSASPAA